VRIRLYVRSSGLLHSVQWNFCTDVSGHPFGPILKGSEVYDKELLFDLLILEDGTDRLSPDVGTELPLYTA